MNYYLKRKDAVSLSDVLYLEALENYTRFHLSDGSSVISSLTLKHHQEKLSSETFLRINRSTLVNTDHVKNVFLKDEVKFVMLNSGQEIKVSRRRQDTLLNLVS